MPTWDEVPLLGSTPPAGSAPGHAFRVGGLRYWECGGTGFDMMIAWVAGFATLRKFPDFRVPMTSHTETRPGRRPRTWQQPMDDEFAGEIEDAINGYLTDAGLPGRPAGFRWFQTCPGGLKPIDLYDAAVEAQSTAGRSARHQAAAVRQAIAALYRSAGG
jgi:hypothetical protein